MSTGLGVIKDTKVSPCMGGLSEVICKKDPLYEYDYIRLVNLCRQIWISLKGIWPLSQPHSDKIASMQLE